MTGRVLHTLEGHENIVTAIGFSPDGDLLATGGHNDKIIFWNVETGEQVFEFGSSHNFRKAALEWSQRSLDAYPEDPPTDLPPHRRWRS